MDSVTKFLTDSLFEAMVDNSRKIGALMARVSYLENKLNLVETKFDIPKSGKVIRVDFRKSSQK